MFNKNVALAVLLFCSPAFALIGDHNHYKTEEENKINEKKLSILEKDLEETANIRKKLMLNESLITVKNICFCATAAATLAAAASCLSNDPKKGLSASAIVGVVALGIGAGYAYDEDRKLQNLSESQETIINAINHIKQH